ncbi:putative ATP-dependent RNA helicase DDX10 [Babylonia areolata]|uniref:putative ATP-dependent RNA helicase DDX10 n=1 Tax=Babylonia areolata TaxID=304850 RepID=UPI003FD176B8
MSNFKQSTKRFGQSFSFKKRAHRSQPLKKGKDKGLKKSQVVENEINELQQKIDSGIDASKVNSFADFPLSRNTLNGLKKANYVIPTDIQRQAISLALQGKDILGAAKTGSGKTLAFLIPILEVLHKARTSSVFGMAALIITPTRELAFQIFEVLNKIRTFHDFTANLIIGGKKMWREEHLMANTNIVVCTVGRLLHHLDQTPSFSADDLKILVLDEADRIMDSKFAKDMDHIISHLPTQRQTLMFSATQTKSVKALARLSLKDPSYVSVHEHAKHATPSGLEQSYIVCELHEKLSMLYSFLKNHPNNKIIVFLQTCKQVRYVHTVMKRERPGMSVLALYGGLNQLRRIDIYRDFCRKQHVILFATDLACRGLDFPAVNWVVQLDCPVDVDTYIHRAGRTARFERNGQALLVLMPSEEEHMVEALQRRKIPVKKINVNMSKVQNITGSISAACASCKETKDMAERAFRTYVYSLHVLNKNLVSKLDLEKYAQSLGLFLTPKLRFLKQKKKKSAEDEEKIKDVDEKQEEAEDSTSIEALFKPKTREPVEAVEELGSEGEEEEEEKRTKKKKPITKAALAKKLGKKNINMNYRVLFDEEGSPIKDVYKRRHVDDDEEEEEEGGINVQAASKRLRLEDSIDKQIEKERVKQKHREERLKRKEKKRAAQQQRRAADEEEEEEEGAVLEGGEDDDPFQYIPDPDKLAARNEDESDDDVDGDSSDDDDSDDDDDHFDNNPGDDESEADESSDNDTDEEHDNQEHRRCLEDAAMRILKGGRLKT